MCDVDVTGDRLPGGTPAWGVAAEGPGEGVRLTCRGCAVDVLKGRVLG